MAPVATPASRGRSGRGGWPGSGPARGPAARRPGPASPRSGRCRRRGPRGGARRVTPRPARSPCRCRGWPCRGRCSCSMSVSRRSSCSMRAGFRAAGSASQARAVAASVKSWAMGSPLGCASWSDVAVTAPSLPQSGTMAPSSIGSSGGSGGGACGAIGSPGLGSGVPRRRPAGCPACRARRGGRPSCPRGGPAAHSSPAWLRLPSATGWTVMLQLQDTGLPARCNGDPGGPTLQGVRPVKCVRDMSCPIRSPARTAAIPTRLQAPSTRA